MVEFPSDSPHAVTVHADGGINLRARFSGRGPFDVVFDTGSMNIMSLGLATKLGLQIQGSGAIDAMGGTVSARGAMVDAVQIGGVIMHHQLFAVIDSPSDPNEDFAFIGDQWLQRMPIRVDFEHQQITFYNPRFFHYSGMGSLVPIHIENNSVVAEAAVDGIPGQFEIDTGSVHSLLLNSQFVLNHDLIHRYQATVQGYAGEGFGGPDIGFYTRADILQLGTLGVRRPVTVLLTDKEGGGASNLAGNIGLRVLNRFTLIFDCADDRLYLEKSRNYDKPEIFNRAGIVIDPDVDRPLIRMVFPDSPAADAGVVAGDVILKVNGNPSTATRLETALTQPVGTILHLTLRHGGNIRTVSVTLRDIL